MNIILLGAPGSGKGTQSIILNKKWGLVQLSTGEMIRANIEKKSELGLKVQKIVDSGEFVSDEIILSMVRERITHNDCSKGFILDGFPRNVNQASRFDKILEKENKKINFVIELKVGNLNLYKRIENRAIETSEARADDRVDILENRLKIYEEQTKPLIPYYKTSGLHYEVDGTRSIKEISIEIEKILRSKN